jgi:predicted ATP-grasp superfamily ATP-dependent carboligase
MVKSIAVFEYTVGGGFSKTQLNTKLLVEGYAMLYTVVEDLKNSGYRVITTIDERLASTIKIPTDESMMIPSGETPLEKLESALKFIDGILLIAPAFKDALYEATRFMEKAGVNVLGSKSGGVLKASDKRLTLLSLKKANLPTPKTKVADINENVDEVRLKVEEIGYPVVFKPADGSAVKE